MLDKFSSFADIVAWLIGIINYAIPVLTAAALVLVMYAAFRYVLKSGEAGGKGAEREALLWGLIALFVIVSVWGLLRIMCRTFVGNSTCRAANTTLVNNGNGGLY